MSRTEGVNLPRIPTTHARLTSPQNISVHPAVVKPVGTAGGVQSRTKFHRRSVSEPSYTAYLGTPRQDIPQHVYRDAAMFDDVFEKQGKLLQSRQTPKISNPLNSLGYSSLHDPHCQRLFLNNKNLRAHLMDLGLVTCDLKIVASTGEQRQKIRAHELLERKESLCYKLQTQEQQRIKRLQETAHQQLPSLYKDNMLKWEESRLRSETIQQRKVEKVIKAQELKRSQEEKKRLTERKKMQQAVKEAKLYEQAKRNAARYKQECAELAAYERQYGKVGSQLAIWHRDSDRIHNRMVVMKEKKWSSSSKVEQKSFQIERSTEVSPPVDKPIGQEESSTDPKDIVESKEEVPIPVEAEGDDAENGVTAKSEDEAITNETDVLVEDKEEVQPHTDDLVVSQEQELIQQQLADVKLEEVETGDVPIQADVTILDQEESDAQLASIFTEALQRVDHQGLGFVSIDDFTQMLNSRDFGLELNENELYYIAEQADAGNGWVPFVAVCQQLPGLLVALYNQRAELQIQHYGGYTEDQWCQLFLSTGTVYYSKLTGEIMMGGRPDNFRQFLEDDPFEESIVDFFETADTDKDGVIDVSNVYSLLLSPMVSTRIYSNQMEELLAYFQENTENNLGTLETFAPVAKALLMMIYQNAYPDAEEWIELESRKFGTFLFNKQTGETYVPEITQLPTQQSQKITPTTKKKKKKSKVSKDHLADTNTPSSIDPSATVKSEAGTVLEYKEQSAEQDKESLPRKTEIQDNLGADLEKVVVNSLPVTTTESSQSEQLLPTRSALLETHDGKLETEKV